MVDKIRFLHCADLHINSMCKSIPDHYFKRQIQMLNQLYGIAKKKKCDFIILAGDIYNDKKIPYVEKEAFLNILLENRDIPSIIINGQHDLIDHNYSHLSIIKKMGDSGALNVQVADMKPRILSFDDWSILAIPFQKNITTESAQKLIDAMLEKVPNRDKVIGTFHGMVNGSRNELGYSFPGGIKLPTDVVKYWALGDIHKAQKINERTYYPGSPIQHNFGEVETKRGALLVDIDGSDLKVTRVALKGITPLVTVNLDREEEIPEDCFVAVESATKDMYQDLPANVVRKKKPKNTIKYEYTRDTSNESEILNHELQKLKYSDKVITAAVEKFEKSIKTL
jgi:exonuclease SbcD